MIDVTVLMNVIKENERAFLEVVEKLVCETRKEAGCHAYFLVAVESEMYNYVLHEKWETKEHLEAHNNTAHFKTYVPQLADLSTVIIPLHGQQVM